MIRALAALMLALTSCSCSAAPELEQIHQDLAAQLVKVFGAGTFEPMSVSGRGSANDINSPAEETRRIVYYDARLHLMRDVDFGSWNTPGVASLVTIFGAGPKGVIGARIGGNKAGDEILAHGTAVYKRDGSTWRLIVPAGFSPPVAPTLDALSQKSTSERLLTALQDAVHAVPPGTSPAAQAIVDQELSRAIATIQARIGRLSQGYPIAAGPEGGQYVRFVQALQAAKPMGLAFQALLTQGSVENLNLLRQGDVLLALTQSDVAAQSFAGTGSFAAQGAFSSLRALGSLYPESLHVIVRADSPARSVRDLAGKRIGLGQVGSGSRVTVERLLKAYGMEPGQAFSADDKPLSSALSALQSGALDAVMQVIGVPADQVRSAAAAMPFRLLPIDESVLSELTGKDKSMLRGMIATGTYAGVDTSIPTLSVVALLATTGSLGDAEANALIRAIFGNKSDLLAAGSAQAAQINVGTAQLGISIPLANGATAAFSALEGPK